MYNSQASLYRLGLANYSPQANWSEAWFFKNFTFLNSYISTYIIVLILPLCPLSLKYRIPGRWRKFADSWYRYQKTIRIMCCFCNLGKVSGCGQNWWACTGTLSHVDRSEWLLRRMWVFAHFGRSQWMWVKFTKKIFFSMCRYHWISFFSAQGTGMPWPYCPPSDASTRNTSNKVSLSWQPWYDHKAR